MEHRSSGPHISSSSRNADSSQETATPRSASTTAGNNSNSTPAASSKMTSILLGPRFAKAILKWRLNRSRLFLGVSKSLKDAIAEFEKTSSGRSHEFSFCSWTPKISRRDVQALVMYLKLYAPHVTTLRLGCRRWADLHDLLVQFSGSNTSSASSSLSRQIDCICLASLDLGSDHVATVNFDYLQQNFVSRLPACDATTKTAGNSSSTRSDTTATTSTTVSSSSSRTSASTLTTTTRPEQPISERSKTSEANKKKATHVGALVSSPSSLTSSYYPQPPIKELVLQFHYLRGAAEWRSLHNFLST